MSTDPKPLNVISVHSYKGGVGKTTLTALLGAGLAKRDQKVCLIDLDLLAPALASILRVWKPGRDIGDYLFRSPQDGSGSHKPYDPQDVCQRVELPWPGSRGLPVWLVPARADYELARNAQAYLLAEVRSGLLELRLEYLLETLRDELGITVFLLDLPPSLFGISGAIWNLVNRRKGTMLLLSSPSQADVRGTQAMLVRMIDIRDEKDKHGRPAQPKDKTSKPDTKRPESMALVMNRLGSEDADYRKEISHILSSALGVDAAKPNPELARLWLRHFQQVVAVAESPNIARFSQVRLSEDEPLPSLDGVLSGGIGHLVNWLIAGKQKKVKG